MLLRQMVSPRYVLGRLQLAIHERRHPGEPWLSGPAVRFLDEHLSRDGTGIEFGSGRSTQWFAQRLHRLVSVEHDRAWYDRVRPDLDAIPGVDLRHVPLDHPETQPTVPVYDPVPGYVLVADEFDDGTLDFALVDGHYRQACVLAVLTKLRAGGLLVIDNSDWLPMVEWGVPADWPLVHQSRNVKSQTSIWRKP